MSGLAVGDLGQDGREVGVRPGVVFLADDLAATCGEGLLEELGQALDVVVGLVEHDEGGLGLQVLHGELGAHRALERVDEAGAEDVVLDLAVRADGHAGLVEVGLIWMTFLALAISEIGMEALEQTSPMM